MTSNKEEMDGLKDVLAKKLSERGLLNIGTPTQENEVIVSSGSSYKVIQKDPEVIEEGGVIEIESDTVVDEDNNYRMELCKKYCVIRDVVGCEECGIYHYAFKRNLFKIKVTKQE